MLEDTRQIQEWEKIGRDCLTEKNLSASELNSVLIGLTRSQDEKLKESLRLKYEKAWRAKNVK
jgi:hypothetical protein